jgi:hypothetical protein
VNPDLRKLPIRALKRVGREARVYVPMPDRRRFRLYGVGAAKTGTTSLAKMFQPHFRSAHEPDALALIDWIVNRSEDRSGLRRWLVKRDRRSMHEVDSSQFNADILDLLLDLFPESRFVLTIRNPVDWLESTYDHDLGRPADKPWSQLNAYRVRQHTRYSPYDAQLELLGLRPVDSLLAYWAINNRTVLSVVPAERLLIVRTDQLTQRVADIAEFAGVPVELINLSSSHSYRAEKRYHTLATIDRHYIEDRVTVHCGDLLKRFFPETS